MVRSILLVEIAEGDGAAANQVKHMSLGNCKQQVLAHIERDVILLLTCNDVEHLNKVITNNFAKIEGVMRITTCVLIKS
jgi:DNA-binding Lrp family transcriptional regulator